LLSKVDAIRAEQLRLEAAAPALTRATSIAAPEGDASDAAAAAFDKLKTLVEKSPADFVREASESIEEETPKTTGWGSRRHRAPQKREASVSAARAASAAVRRAVAPVAPTPTPDDGGRVSAWMGGHSGYAEVAKRSVEDIALEILERLPVERAESEMKILDAWLEEADRMDFLYSLPAQFRRDLLRVSTTRRFRAGEAIYTRGQSADAMYVLLSGGCHLRRWEGQSVWGPGPPRSARYNRRTATTVGSTEEETVSEGEVFGEDLLLASLKHRFTLWRKLLSSVERRRRPAGAVRPAVPLTFTDVVMVAMRNVRRETVTATADSLVLVINYSEFSALEYASRKAAMARCMDFFRTVPLCKDWRYQQLRCAPMHTRSPLGGWGGR
jgi:CRP-like cAMP-binding protein